jgi:hypothetical protein
MTHLYPLFWYGLGFLTYHYVGVYSKAKRKLFSGGEIDLSKRSRLS